MKKILICICTYKRNDSLVNCLKSINNLILKNHFELNILIVDNTINFNSENEINKLKKKFDIPILHFNEKKRGIVHARNFCLKHIKKIKPFYVSFIDDDCILDRKWLLNITNILNKRNADVITGPQKYIEKISIINNKNLTKFFEKTYNKNILQVKWAATNNVFFKYKILKNNNLKFDSKLNKFGMGEDQLFFLQLNNLGAKIFWSKNVKVYEKLHKHRSSINWLKLRSYRLGILGHYIDQKMYGYVFGLIFNYIKCFYYLFKSIINILFLLRKKKETTIKILNYFYRAKGKFLGPILFKKVGFLK